ncbi:MAG: T9SS type A sorting domain-containing protein [Chitinophagaceae bacterium]|nr:T9SS type A sorting domain-containing protein [Chitinophagaceae bacterium]
MCITAMSLAHAQTPVFDWARSAWGTGNEQPAGIAADAAGNTYVAGNFDSNTDFDPGPGVLVLEPQGLSDIYLLKLDPGGSLVWAKQVGGSGLAFARSLSLDAAGNILIAGSFVDTCDFDPGPGAFKLVSDNNRADVFVLKLDAGGSLSWAKSMGGPEYDEANAVSPDPAGNIFVSGIFTGTADFDPGPGNTDLVSAGGRDIFVCKLNSSGDLVWARGVGGSEDERSLGRATDGAGQVYTTGTFKGTGDFDPGAGSYPLSAGSEQVFLCKLDASGSFSWAHSMDVSTAMGMKAGNDGYLYLCGYFLGKIDIDPGPGKAEIKSTGGYDIYILKLDTAGKYEWARSIGGSDDDIGSALVLDDKNNIYITGSFQNTVDFDPGPGTEMLSCNDDFFILRLDAEGKFNWAKNAVGLSTGTGIAMNKDLDVFVCGWFLDKTDFDPDSGVFDLSPAGDGSTTDLFVHKMKQLKTGIAPLTPEGQMLVYPNPGTGVFSVTNPAPGLELELEITDGAGRIIKKQSCADNPIRIDLRGQAEGLYLLRATSGESTIGRQLILKQ